MRKIPEGATHTAPDGTYRMARGSIWYGYADGDWVDIDGASPHRYTKIQAEPEWSGEGLPPVGTECEIKHANLGWVKCEIVAHKKMKCGGKTHAIAWIDGNNLDQSQGIRFRPIKTPEQIRAESISAEERNKNIDKIQEIYEMAMSTSRRGHSSRPAIEALYDAGLRFVEVTK